jgi:hypothetical protein
LVGNLVEMGFTRNQSERALRGSRYRLANAIDRIIAGDFPDDGPPEPAPAPAPRELVRTSSGPNFGPLPDAY